MEFKSHPADTHVTDCARHRGGGSAKSRAPAPGLTQSTGANRSRRLANNPSARCKAMPAPLQVTTESELSVRSTYAKCVQLLARKSNKQSGCHRRKQLGSIWRSCLVEAGRRLFLDVAHFGVC